MSRKKEKTYDFSRMPNPPCPHCGMILDQIHFTYTETQRRNVWFDRSDRYWRHSDEGKYHDSEDHHINCPHCQGDLSNMWSEDRIWYKNYWDYPENAECWVYDGFQCPKCKAMHKEAKLDKKLMVCPSCNYRIGEARFDNKVPHGTRLIVKKEKKKK